MPSLMTPAREPHPADTLTVLERLYNAPDTIPDRRHPEEECWVFPDGWASAICSNWARYAMRIHGADRCQIFGFFYEEMPQSAIAREYGGHDFAVVDGRYLVDGWARHVACITTTAVFDLDDPANLDEVTRLFGPREIWPRNRELEAAVIQECPASRQKALAGVKLWRATHKRRPRNWKPQ